MIESIALGILWASPSLRPHLSGSVPMAASIDSDILHCVLRQCTVRILLYTIAPLAFFGSAMVIESAGCIDREWPLINRRVASVGCPIYLGPCVIIGWCSYEYGICFSYVVETQLSEAQAIASHFWSYTPLGSHDPQNQLLIEVTAAILTMSHMILLAAAQVNVFRDPMFSEIIIFSFPVSQSLSLLMMISYIFFKDFGFSSQRTPGKNGAAKIDGLGERVKHQS